VVIADDPDAEKAATVIQARFKGYMVRKSVTEDKEEVILFFLFAAMVMLC